MAVKPDFCTAHREIFLCERFELYKYFITVITKQLFVTIAQTVVCNYRYIQAILYFVAVL